MYAQALFLFKEGFQYWWADSDIKELENRNEEFTQGSLEEEYLLMAFENPEEKIPDAECTFLTTSDIADKIAKQHDRMNINGSVIRNLGKALNKHRFKRISRYGGAGNGPLYKWRVKPLFLPPTDRELPEIEGNGENEII